MFQGYQNNTLIMFNKSNFRDKKEYEFDDAGNIPAFEETKRELEKLKQELAHICGFENYDKYYLHKHPKFVWEEKQGILVPKVDKINIIEQYNSHGSKIICSTIIDNQFSIKYTRYDTGNNEVIDIIHNDKQILRIGIGNNLLSNSLKFHNDTEISKEYFNNFGAYKNISYFSGIIPGSTILLEIRTYIYQENPINLIVHIVHHSNLYKKIFNKRFSSTHDYERTIFEKYIEEKITVNDIEKTISTPVEDLIFEKDYTQKDYDFIYNKFILPIITCVTN